MDAWIFYGMTLLMAPVIIGFVLFDLMEEVPFFVIGGVFVWAGSYLGFTKRGIRPDAQFRGLFESASEIAIASIPLGTCLMLCGAFFCVSQIFLWRRAHKAAR